MINTEKVNVVQADDYFSNMGLFLQLEFDKKREFLEHSKSITSITQSEIGTILSFFDPESKKLRFSAEKQGDGNWKITECNFPEQTWNKRNNPSPSGSDDAMFGHGFASSGGNSPWQDNW